MVSIAPHERAKPLAKGSTYQAKDLCSQCGLCDSRWVAYVRQACAFLNKQFEAMEERVHGRSRDLNNEDELYFGVSQRMLSARLRQPIEGASGRGLSAGLALGPWKPAWWMRCCAWVRAPTIALPRCQCWPEPLRRCWQPG